MLVLHRRIGETVMIADDMSVTVLGVMGGKVRLGLTAPPTVPIHREEIYERIKREAVSPREPQAAGTSGTLKRRQRMPKMRSLVRREKTSGTW